MKKSSDTEQPLLLKRAPITLCRIVHLYLVYLIDTAALVDVMAIFMHCQHNKHFMSQQVCKMSIKRHP